MKKLIHEDVYNYYKKYEYKMISLYNGCKNKDILICPVGHEIKMRYNDFKSGYRCLKCSGLEKHSHDFIFNYYKENNYTMNSFYINSHNKDELICSNGHNIKMSFHTFSNGVRCGKCFHLNNTGINHYKWKSDRSRRSRSKYLSFDLYHINILKNDPNYKLHFQFDNEYKRKNNNVINKKYSVDHIFPRVAFIDNEFDKIYGEELCKKIANKRNNLRIIDQKYNSSKGGKYNQEEFMNWFTNELILEYTNI